MRGTRVDVSGEVALDSSTRIGGNDGAAPVTSESVAITAVTGRSSW